MEDSETLDCMTKCTTTDNPDDFPRIGVDLIKKINFKVAAFLFFVGLFIFSDIFIENFIPRNMVDGFCADSKGTAIQLLVFVLAYIVLDLLVQGRFI